MNVKFNDNQQGNVLLYTILAIAVMINTIIIITNLVVSDVRQSTNFDQSTRAFYAAESGAEHVLYQYRKNDTLWPAGDCGVFNLTCEVTVNEDSMTSMPVNLAKNDSFQIDVADGPAGVESLVLSWLDNGSWVEVSSVEWDSIDAVWREDSVDKFLFTGGSGIVNSFSGAKQYKIRIKALYDAVAGTVQLFDGNNGSGSPIGIPASVSFTALGEYENSVQKVTVSLPPGKSLLGLFDYVLFSEEAIVK